MFGIEHLPGQKSSKSGENLTIGNVVEDCYWRTASSSGVWKSGVGGNIMVVGKTICNGQCNGQ